MWVIPWEVMKKLTSKESDIIVGLLLGDGHLEKTSSGKFRLCIAHGVKQRAYVDMLYESLKRFVATPPKLRWARDKRYNQPQPKYSFKTVCRPEFLEFYRMFYKENKRKYLPKNIDQFFKPQTLAILFMDDGSFKNDSRGLLLNTMAFSKGEQRILRKAFKDKLQILTGLHTLRRWKRIYIPAKESERFVNIIRPYLHPSMQYKIKRVLS